MTQNSSKDLYQISISIRVKVSHFMTITFKTLYRPESQRSCPGGSGSDTQNSSLERRSSLGVAAQESTLLYYHNPAGLRTQVEIQYFISEPFHWTMNH